jgi:hypothetical protein
MVEATPFVDTHEHLIEESMRVGGETNGGNYPCDDWSYLFMHYCGDDLCVSGMPDADFKMFLSPDTALDEKYLLVAPYWERVKHTGYGRAVRLALRGLYDIDDLTEETAPAIEERYRDMVQPGFYAEILRKRSNIEVCQVNSLDRIFRETEQPDLLLQDIGFPPLSADLDIKRVESEFGRTAATLEGWLAIVDGIFSEFGPRAVATKSQSAYGRRLDYEPATEAEAAPLFARIAAGEAVSRAERKPLEDFLFRHCVTRATEQGLPVKLHCGYYAGRNGMPLERVRKNASDLCRLLQDFPETKFVLMHIGYPYQDEFIALAKHYSNVTIDMCWAWIIDPVASARFVTQFLVAAPSNKLLTFGGDYITVETVYGHSRIARQGLVLALSQLVEAGWIPLEECPELIDRIMRGNAHALFPVRP